MQARFVTLEGLDGTGKSTHLDWIVQLLRDAGLDLVKTREPGGTALGERLRELLLHEPMDLRTETLLMFAARNEHWRACIEPALKRGQWVLSDRFTDASFAYQGGGRGLGTAPIRTLEDWVLGDVKPDCTILFDAPLAIVKHRLQDHRADLDRFEAAGDAFFERTRAAYLDRAREDPQRFHIVDSSGSILQTRQQLKTILDDLLHAADRRDGLSKTP